MRKMQEKALEVAKTGDATEAGVSNISKAEVNPCPHLPHLLKISTSAEEYNIFNMRISLDYAQNQHVDQFVSSVDLVGPGFAGRS